MTDVGARSLTPYPMALVEAYLLKLFRPEYLFSPDDPVLLCSNACCFLREDFLAEDELLPLPTLSSSDEPAPLVVFSTAKLSVVVSMSSRISAMVVASSNR